MENTLSSLNSLAETWLTLGSASCYIDLNYTFLSGLGLLLLYLCYLSLKLVLQSPSPWEKKHTPQPKGRTESKRRKAVKGGRTGQTASEEGSRLLQTTLQSLDKLHDPTDLHKLLHPDPFCHVPNKADAQASCLLSQAPLQVKAVLLSHLPSTAFTTETSLYLFSHLPAKQPALPVPEALPQPSSTSPSLLSPHQIIPLDGFPSPPPLSASLSPQASAPLNPAALLNHITLNAFPPPLPHATQEAHSINKQPLDPCASPGSNQRPTRVPTIETGDPSSPNPDILALFKRQEKRETDFTASKHEKEKAEFFSMPLNTSEQISVSMAGPKNSEVTSLSGNWKDKPGGPQLYQQPSPPKNSEDQSEIKDIQLFWGPPSLHSEFLEHEDAAPRNSYSESTHFNGMAKASTGNSTLLHPTPLPLPESDQQVWPQVLPQSQTKPDSSAKSEAQSNPVIQVLPPSPQSQLRICGVRFHGPQEWAQPLGPSEIHQLEFNLLQKALESFGGLPTVAQRFPGGFCHPPLKISTRNSSKVYGPRLILPGDFPLTTEVRRKLEHHLRKRLIQHRWGLPYRISESLSHMCPRSELAKDAESGNSHGLSWISLYKLSASRNPSSFALSRSGSLHKRHSDSHAPKEEDLKVCRKCPRIDQKYHLQRNSNEATEGSVDPGSEAQVQLKPGSMSRKISKTSWVKQCQKECETLLQEHLGKKTKESREGEILGTVDKSRRSVSTAQPPPDTTPKQTKALAPLAGDEDPLKTHQHSLALSPTKEKALEEHIKIQPASGNRKVFVDQKAPSGREAVQPWTPGMVDKGSLQQFGSHNRHGPELPMSPDGPTDERLASSTNTQRPWGERKSWEDGSMAEGSMELLKKEELPGLHPQATKIFTAPRGTCSSGSHVATNESLQEMSSPHNSETSGKKGQVSRGGLLNSESGAHIQVPGLPALPFASEEVASKGQGPPSGDLAASQVMHAHLPTVGVSMEPWQGPWVPAHVPGKLQNKDCPPAARRVSPLATEAEKLGGGDAGSETSPTRGERHSVQARAPEGPHGHSSSPALAPKRQPPENHFTSQVRSFLQRLSPGRKRKGQQRPLAKDSFPPMSAKGTSLTQGRCESCGNSEAQKCARDPGVLLRKQLGHRSGTATPCPQAPVPPLIGSAEAQQEVQGQAEAEPVQRPHSWGKAPCCQVQRAEFCSPGQGQAAPDRCGIVGEAKMVETSPMCASQETESHQGPVYRCRAGQVNCTWSLAGLKKHRRLQTTWHIFE
nr:putative spermatogenesis-associated protein 31D3 [Meriones unguiculatus]